MQKHFYTQKIDHYTVIMASRILNNSIVICEKYLK